jgi:hypothetical protein
MTDEQKLAWFEARAEAGCDKMYDATNNTEAAARCSDTKEARYEAIRLARRLGQDAQVTRLDHIKAVFRSHFG